MEMEMDTSKKSGKNQILDKIDIDATAQQFVNYYYGNIRNFQAFILSKTIRDHSRFKFNKTKYENGNLLSHLQFLSQCEYYPLDMESIDSGTRRIDINVIGRIKLPNKQVKVMSQYFGICHDKTSWYIKTSSLTMIK